MLTFESKSRQVIGYQFVTPLGDLYTSIPADYTVIATAELNSLLALAEQRRQDTTSEYKQAWGQFHRAGRDAFGQQWDTVRPRIVHLVSRGRTQTSKGLSLDELVETTRALDLRAGA